MLKVSIEKLDAKFILKNDGHLSLFFLGCGTAFSKKLYQNNAIIIKGDTSIFVDFGTRAPYALYSLGHNVSSISNLIITHSHADHIGGVEEILLTNRYFFKKKLNLIVPQPMIEIIWEESLKGGCAYSEYKAGNFLNLFDYVEYINPEQVFLYYKENRLFYKIKVGTINILFFQTKHIPSDQEELKYHRLSFGLIIDDKILYTSDTKFDKDFIEFLVSYFNIDYIFHDCQFFTGGVHASIEEIDNFDLSIKNKLFLMHYPDDYENFDINKYKVAGYAKQWHFYNFR